MEPRYIGHHDLDDKEAEPHIEHNSSDKELPISHIKQSGPVRKPLGQRLKAYYKKWWWLYSLLLIAVVLIVTLPLVYVAFPKIAQDGVNSSTLEIQSLIITNPTQESFHLNQVNIVRSNNTYHPQLDSFNASLSLEGSDPYAYIHIPHVHATAEATTTIAQDVRITDIDRFIDYNIALLGNEQLNLAVKGRTELHEMRFPATAVSYDKVVTLKGLNKLQGFNITSFQIMLSPEADGTNMVGEVHIPNPTVLTVEMGNVTFNTFCEGDYLGNSTILNLNLKPGNNTLPMRSNVNQTLVLTKLTTGPKYKDGFLPIDIVGNSSIYNGAHLTYFERALQSNTQHISLNVGQALSALGINITSI